MKSRSREIGSLNNRIALIFDRHLSSSTQIDQTILNTNFTASTLCEILKQDVSWILKRGPASDTHDDVIKWKHFPRNWPFVREIHRSPVNFPHKGQWRGALMFSFIYAWINDWVNNREAGDLRRQHGHYDVIIMKSLISWWVVTIMTHLRIQKSGPLVGNKITG